MTAHVVTTMVADAKEKAQRRQQQHPYAGSTKEECEAAKKKHKQEKEMRKKLAKGGIVRSKEEYEEVRAQQLEATERNKYPLLRPKTFAVPFDVTPLEIKARDPELYNLLKSGNVPKVTQKDTPYRARAIWLNDYNPKRSFSLYHHQCRLLFACLKYRLRRYKDLGKLEELFVGAVLERSDGIETFDHRNDFVQMWISSPFDLYVFPKKDLKAFKSMVKDLREALPKIMSQVGQSERKPNLPKSGSAFSGLAANMVHSKIPAFASNNSLPQPTRTFEVYGEEKRKELFGTIREGQLGEERVEAHMQDLDLEDDEDGEDVAGDPTDRISRTWEDLHAEIVELMEGEMTDSKRAKVIELSEQLGIVQKRNYQESQLKRTIKDFEEMEF